MEIIKDKRLISKCQKAFVSKLMVSCTEKIECYIGYKGDSEAATAHYSPKYDFWFTSRPNVNRFWNAFGMGKPLAGKPNSITVEINFPYSEINRAVGGAFALGEDGEILILHRGKIGGGRSGIGKKLFFDQFRGDKFVSANDDGLINEFCLIDTLTSKNLAKQVSDFIVNVDRIKNIKVEGENFESLNDFKFSEEGFGESELERKASVIVKRLHGSVVNTLAKNIEAKGLSVGNDRNRHLFIFKKKKILTLFEVKVDSSSQSLHTAIGQLLIYSLPIKTDVKLVIVIPDKVTKPVSNLLSRLGIDVLYYKWQKHEPIFTDLSCVLGL